MGREIFNKIIGSRVFYIVFSIIISIVLWVYVEYNENNDVTVTIDDIRVVLLNEDLLHDRNLVVSRLSDETVTLKYEGKRSSTGKLNSSNMQVTVDLASVTASGSWTLPYNIVFPADVNNRAVTLVSSSVSRITITFDKMYTKSVPVDVVYTGGTADEYIAEPPEFSPESITVFGPEPIVSRIEKAWVDIKRENLSKTIVEELPFVLLDKDGNEISTEGLTLSNDTTRVTIPVKMVKEIPLKVDFIEGAGANQQNIRYTISPATVTLSGEADAFKDFNSIHLGSVDLTNFPVTTVQPFTIIVPNNLTNISQVTEAVVTVDIIGLESRQFSVTNIQPINVPTGMRATVITQSIRIMIRGPLRDINELTPGNIRVVVDMNSYSTGTSTIKARVLVDGDYENSGAVGQYDVTVKLESDE